METASWAVQDEGSRYFPLRQARLQADYALWRACQPLLQQQSEEDWTTLAAQLYSQAGVRKHEVTRYLDALDVLDRLPHLRAFVEETWLLDMNHLSTIEKAARKAPVALQNDDYFWAALDEDLMERFTPSRHRQLLPSSHAITSAVTATIRSVENLAAPQEDAWGAPDPEEPAPGPQPCENPAEFLSSVPPVEEARARLFIEDLSGGDVRFELLVDQATGTLIADAIEQLAGERRISRAEALKALIMEDVTTSVTTMMYSAKDVDDAPVHHPGRGILTPETVEILRRLQNRTLDMDAAQVEECRAYETNDRVRAYLIGRDGTCRWPGCTRRATHCDADHRINYDDGGPTASSNLVMLCRHHHNRKTDESIFYLLDPHTGDVHWLFSDGTWVVDEATGPLAPRQRNWVQTWVQRGENHRIRLAERAAAERLEAYQERMRANAPPEPEPEPPEEDPPPF